MTAVLIGLAIWLVLAVLVALFVGRAIALGLNSTHMPDEPTQTDDGAAQDLAGGAAPSSHCDICHAEPFGSTGQSGICSAHRGGCPACGRDDFDQHAREALAVVDEGRGPHVPADVMRIIDAASPKDQEDAKRALFMKEGMVQ